MMIGSDGRGVGTVLGDWGMTHTLMHTYTDCRSTLTSQCRNLNILIFEANLCKNIGLKPFHLIQIEMGHF